MILLVGNRQRPVIYRDQIVRQHIAVILDQTSSNDKLHIVRIRIVPGRCLRLHQLKITVREIRDRDAALAVLIVDRKFAVRQRLAIRNLIFTGSRVPHKELEFRPIEINIPVLIHLLYIYRDTCRLVFICKFSHMFRAQRILCDDHGACPLRGPGLSVDCVCGLKVIVTSQLPAGFSDRIGARIQVRQAVFSIRKIGIGDHLVEDLFIFRIHADDCKCDLLLLRIRQVLRAVKGLPDLQDAFLRRIRQTHDVVVVILVIVVIRMIRDREAVNSRAQLVTFRSLGLLQVVRVPLLERHAGRILAQIDLDISVMGSAGTRGCKCSTCRKCDRLARQIFRRDRRVQDDVAFGVAERVLRSVQRLVHLSADMLEEADPVDLQLALSDRGNRLRLGCLVTEALHDSFICKCNLPVTDYACRICDRHLALIRDRVISGVTAVIICDIINARADAVRRFHGDCNRLVVDGNVFRGILHRHRFSAVHHDLSGVENDLVIRQPFGYIRAEQRLVNCRILILDIILVREISPVHLIVQHHRVGI